MRIADKARLETTGADIDQQLDSLREADLVDSTANNQKYFVTAKGPQVARDLEKIAS